jgi:hypothetical protein
LHTVTLDYHYHTATPNNSSTILKWNQNYYDTPEIISEELLYPAFSPVEDSYVDSRNKTTNYGTLTTLSLSKSGSTTKRVYLKFKVSGLTGKTAETATLRLYYRSSDATLNFKVAEIDCGDANNPTWKESTLNYRLAQVLSESNEKTYSVAPQNGYIDIVLDSTMFNDGSGVYGLALEPTSNCSAEFYSREIETDTTLEKDYGPRLTLLFTQTPEQNNENIGITYKCMNTNTSTGTLQPWFRITNNGTMPLDLSHIKIRYWYTREASVAQHSVCDHAGVNSGISYTTITSEVSITCLPMATTQTNANYYVEIAFTNQRYLPAGAYVELQNRIYNSNWSNYTQSNDYSFNASLSSFGENTQVTAYSDEVLFFGVEP